MPRPELLPTGFTVLKLDNGYNIGIQDSKIRNVEIIRKRVVATPRIHTSEHNPKLPTVAMFSTGGTIASRIDYATGGVAADYSSEELLDLVPGLRKIANIQTTSIMNAMSEDMTPEHWKQIAQSILPALKNPKISGIVITHGTDTMHYTSAALSFFIKNLNKPVIITGSQRSIDRGSSDAFLNVYCSVTAAAQWDGAEVAICMHTNINDNTCDLHRGTKVRKMHTSRRDAFKTVNDTPLARIDDAGEIKVLNQEYSRRRELSPELLAAFEEKTALLQVYPGMDPLLITTLADHGYRGIVLSATALGHICTSGKTNLLPAIEHAQKKGAHIIIASQTLYGRTHPYVYTNLRKLSIGRGCLFADDMLPEVAYVKLGWLLGRKLTREEVSLQLTTNIAHEINHRHQPCMF